MIRVCPHSDSKCSNGMACTFSCATDDYDGTKRPVTPSNANTSGLGEAGLSETYCFAYESIRNGAPGLSDATCAAIARSINMKVSLSTISRATAAEARADRLADSNEGLTEDLYQAVLVAYRRGAHEWAWLNYPQWRNALAAGQEVAPIARAALQQETQP